MSYTGMDQSNQFILRRNIPNLISKSEAEDVKPVYVIPASEVGWLASFLEESVVNGLTGSQRAAAGCLHYASARDGRSCAVFFLDDNRGFEGPHRFGALAQLPEGIWEPVVSEALSMEEVALGFCLGAYAFDRFKQSKPQQRAGTHLLISDEVLLRRVERLALSVYLARDLINTPANILGPMQLAQAACDVAKDYGAELDIVQGEELQRSYPAVAAVGAGSEQPACVVVLRWSSPCAGAEAPLVCLVGKGVCFDTGGYDIKPSSAMLRMKKDMGGAAIMLALAGLIMAAGLPVRLELRLGCVENSISGHALRPSDVVFTRAGYSVEVGNTDAEGRLVLCDLLTESVEQDPAILVDVATLTGAARVALGPDIPAFFTADDALAEEFSLAAQTAADPLWRLPLWQPYNSWLESDIADFNNVSTIPMAGAITAALFLKRFVPEGIKWMHIDTYAWNDTARPGRPKGGEVQALRALWQYFYNHFGQTP